MSQSEIDSNNGAGRKPTQTNGTSQVVPNHSPGAPEATHTVQIPGEDPTNNGVERPAPKVSSILFKVLIS